MNKENIMKHWPLVVATIWLLSAVVLLLANKKIGYVVFGLLVVYLAIVLWIFLKKRIDAARRLGVRGEQYGFTQNVLMMSLPNPYAVMADDGKILCSGQGG